jgi:hypothetical protein
LIEKGDSVIKAPVLTASPAGGVETEVVGTLQKKTKYAIVKEYESR